MLNQLVIYRAAIARAGEVAFTGDTDVSDFSEPTLRTATNVTAMVVGFCLVLLGMVVLTSAF